MTKTMAKISKAVAMLFFRIFFLDINILPKKQPIMKSPNLYNGDMYVSQVVRSGKLGLLKLRAHTR